MSLSSRFVGLLLIWVAMVCFAAPLFAGEDAPPEPAATALEEDAEDDAAAEEDAAAEKDAAEEDAGDDEAGQEDGQQDGPAPQYAHPVLIHFEGPIIPMLEQYLYRHLAAAEEDGADLIILEIDSPGGYADPSFAIAERLQELDIRTVAYIPREALSGAAFVALGCDDIVMGPKAILGDAGAIYLNEFGQFEHVPEKIRSKLSRKVADIAKAGGRPEALAEAMVDKDLVVWKVRNTRTGTITYMSEGEIDASEAPGQWEKLHKVEETTKGNFLTINGEQAVQLTLADENVGSMAELKESYEIGEFEAVYEWTWVDTFALLLNWWPLTILLFLVGIIALYIEFSAPGIGVGGLTAVLCFALFFWSRFLGGTADWLEIVLFAAGLMFIAVELFVLPGFGVAGLTGILLLLASLVMASQGSFDPESPEMWRTLTKNLLVLASAGVMSALSVVYLSSRMGTLPVFKRLILSPPAAGDTDEPGEEEPEPDVRVGASGVAQSALRPAGKAQFGKEYVNVVTDGDFINHGARIEIIEITGNRIVVREIA
jgi:membrane-bound serine protease (ClpP class)